VRYIIKNNKMKHIKEFGRITESQIAPDESNLFDQKISQNAAEEMIENSKADKSVAKPIVLTSDKSSKYMPWEGDYARKVLQRMGNSSGKCLIFLDPQDLLSIEAKEDSMCFVVTDPTKTLSIDKALKDKSEVYLVF
jgi:hypothetical protein